MAAEIHFYDNLKQQLANCFNPGKSKSFFKAKIYFADKPQRTNAESAIRQMRDADVVS
jgi:hypothetical protein